MDKNNCPLSKLGNLKVIIINKFKTYSFRKNYLYLKMKINIIFKKRNYNNHYFQEKTM